MKDIVKMIEDRIKYLNRLSEVTPINFSIQSRILEAEHLLDEINKESKK